jgi:hypothetical protein
MLVVWGTPGDVQPWSLKADGGTCRFVMSAGRWSTHDTEAYQCVAEGGCRPTGRTCDDENSWGGDAVEG